MTRKNQPRRSAAEAGLAGAPIQVVRSGSTTLTLGAACSVTNQCLERFGLLVYSVVAPITVKVQSGSGLAYIYVTAKSQ